MISSGYNLIIGLLVLPIFVWILAALVNPSKPSMSSSITANCRQAEFWVHHHGQAQCLQPWPFVVRCLCSCAFLSKLLNTLSSNKPGSVAVTVLASEPCLECGVCRISQFIILNIRVGKGGDTMAIQLVRGCQWFRVHYVSGLISQWVVIQHRLNLDHLCLECL